MNLQDYQWSRNPRGLHNAGPFRPFDVARYTQPHMGWAKLVAGGDEYVGAAGELIAGGCTPIVRIARTSMSAMAVPDDWYATYKAYIDAGCRWFELYDEPNMDDEWPQGADGWATVVVSYEDTEQVIAPLMDHWLDWAERIVEMGGYPAFPALAETVEPARATVYWINAMLEYLKSAAEARFVKLVGSGLWCATHPYLLNHFYQEPPGGPPQVARPYYQQDAGEGGWHFEYPYDPIQQASDPGRTIFGGTALTPFGDPNGLIAAGEAFQQLVQHHFGVGPVPVVGTAGGIVPLAGGAPAQPDDRYPAYDDSSHAAATLALSRWIAADGPPWLFGVTLSDELRYYQPEGAVPAIAAMQAAPPALKELPSIETGGAQAGPVFTPEPIIESMVPAMAQGETPAAESETEPEVETAMPAMAQDEMPAAESETEPEVEMAAPAMAQDETPAAESEALPDLDSAPAPEVAAPEAAAPEAAEEAVPDWLAEYIQQPQSAEVIEDEEDALQPEEAAPPAAEAEPAAEVVPDWLQEAVEAPAAEAPDWLADLSQPVEIEDLDAAMPAGVDLGQPASEEQPAWLSEADLSDGGTSAPMPVEPAAESADDAMRMSEPPPPAMPPEMPVETEAMQAPTEVPEWLEEGDLTGGAEQPRAAEPAALPDWLSDDDLSPADVEPVAGVSGSLPEDVDEKMGLQEPQPPQPAPEAAPATQAVIELPAWLEEGDLGSAAPPIAVAPAVAAAPQAAPVAVAAPTTEPDTHALIVGPGVDAELLFTTGWRYWQAFQPVLLADWAQIALLPAGGSVAVTALVTQAGEADAANAIRAVRPDAAVDTVLADSPEDVLAELNWRTSTGRRLG